MSKNSKKRRKNKDKEASGFKPGKEIGWHVPVFVLILIGAFLLYYPALDFGFVFDDHTLVEKNPAITSLAATFKQLIPPWHGYRPVRNLSYAIDYAIGGMHPWVFHLSNIIYHLVFLIVLFLVLKSLFKGRIGIVLTSVALFAINPVQIDAVAYVSGRRDVLCAIFTLLAFWCFLKFKKTGKWWLWLPVFLLFLLAFLSKEMGIIVPVLIFLYEFVRELSIKKERDKFVYSSFVSLLDVLKKGWYYYLPMVLIGAGLVLYKVLFSTVSGKLNWWGGNIVTNFLTVAKVLSYYVVIMLFPFSLRADYSYYSFPISFSFFDILGWIALLFIASLVIFFIYIGYRGKFGYSFWGLWIFASLLPVTHIIPHHELMAEHYLYIPMVGFAVLISLFLSDVLKMGKAFRKVIFTAGFLLFLGWILYGLSHITVYANDYMLFSDVVKKAPLCLRANRALGSRFFEMGDYKEALKYYERMTRVEPLFERERAKNKIVRKLKRTFKKGRGEYTNREVGYYVDLYRRLGFIYEKLLDYKNARKMYLKGASFGVVKDMFYDDLGRMYSKIGKREEAIGWFRKALSVDPKNFMVLSNMAAVYSQKGDLNMAMKLLKKSVEINRSFGNGWFNLALAEYKMGYPHESVISCLRKAIRCGVPKGVEKKVLSMIEYLNKIRENPENRQTRRKKN